MRLKAGQSPAVACQAGRPRPHPQNAREGLGTRLDSSLDLVPDHPVVWERNYDYKFLFIAHPEARSYEDGKCTSYQLECVLRVFSFCLHTQPKVKITPKKGSKGKQKSNVVHAEGQGEGGRGVQARRSSRKKGTEEKLVEEGKKRKRTLTNDHTLEGSNVSKRRTLNRPTKKAAARNKDLSPSSSEEVSQRSAGSSAEGGKLEGRERRTRRREVGSGSSGETDMEVAGSLEERREKGGVKEVRVSAGTIAKWKPVSLATRKLLTDAMTSALGYVSDSVSALSLSLSLFPSYQVPAIFVTATVWMMSEDPTGGAQREPFRASFGGTSYLLCGLHFFPLSIS